MQQEGWDQALAAVDDSEESACSDEDDGDDSLPISSSSGGPRRLEQDLELALHNSAEDTYSGDFGVPPACQTTLSHSTSICFLPDACSGNCVICASDFVAGECVRVLGCMHRFHMLCVDEWLSQSGQCPVCKHRVGS